MVGVVKWFNDKRGFGFIAGQDNEEYFVHFSAIQREGFKSLSEGDEVEFDIETGANGKLKATNVVVLTE